MPSRAPSHKTERQQPADARRSAAQRGYDAHWQRYRKWFLTQPQNVLCADCRHRLATVVDHRTPHKGDHELFWDPANHQALCAHCHNRKTATSDGGFGKLPERHAAKRCINE